MKTPILLWAPPGVGKSEAWLQWAIERSMGRNVAQLIGAIPDPFRAPIAEFVLRSGGKLGIGAGLKYAFIAGQEDPVDTTGCIVANNGHSERKVPLWWLVAHFLPVSILCDELTACGPEQFAAVLRATDDARELCGWKLHDETIVMAAANPPEFAAGAARELAAPVLSRFRHVKIDGSAAVDWMNGGPGIKLQFPVAPPIPQMPRIGAAYLRSNPGAALATGEQIRSAVEKQEPFPCPRAWWRFWSEEGDLRCGGEYVGAEAAGAFLQWFVNMDLPSPVEIVAGRCKTIPTRGDAVMATAAAVAGELGKTPSDDELANAFDWYRLVAEAGHAANACMDVRAICKLIGTEKASRYGKELVPYAEMLRIAGSLK